MSVVIEHEYCGVADRSGWRPGPWDAEPQDKLQWTDSETGLPCLMLRNYFGQWCGYAGVSEGHPLYGVGYMEQSQYGKTPEDILEVHGGITYSGYCLEGPEESSICHIPKPGEPDHVFWFGFDTGHHLDDGPNQVLSIVASYQSHPQWADYYGYRDITYVQRECQNLARQLKDMEQPGWKPPADDEDKE